MTKKEGWKNTQMLANWTSGDTVNYELDQPADCQTRDGAPWPDASSPTAEMNKQQATTISIKWPVMTVIAILINLQHKKPQCQATD